jgi:hypothetical protein
MEYILCLKYCLDLYPFGSKCYCKDLRATDNVGGTHGLVAECGTGGRGEKPIQGIVKQL